MVLWVRVSWLDLILVESLEDVHFLHLIDLFGSVSLCLQFVSLDGLCLQLEIIELQLRVHLVVIT